MRIYLNFLEHILKNGVLKSDRTNTGTLSVFGHHMRFDLQEGFPLLTTKRLHVKSIIHELLWFLRGETNISSLNQAGVKIWDAWADEKGDLGPIYGKQWRAWPTLDGNAIDQMQNLINEIKSNPNSRRLIVNAWNVAALPHMALPPCHALFQCYVANNRLSCQLYQRSADVFLGVPFNIAEYALLTYMIAHQCGLEVGEFVWTGGDCHLYRNHMLQAKAQLTRQPNALPQIKFTRKPPSLFEYKYEDFEITGYHPHPSIKAPVAV